MLLLSGVASFNLIYRYLHFLIKLLVILMDGPNLRAVYVSFSIVTFFNVDESKIYQTWRKR